MNFKQNLLKEEGEEEGSPGSENSTIEQFQCTEEKEAGNAPCANPQRGREERKDVLNC